jgi:hypothetical protein
VLVHLPDERAYLAIRELVLRCPGRARSSSDNTVSAGRDGSIGCVRTSPPDLYRTVFAPKSAGDG